MPGLVEGESLNTPLQLEASFQQLFISRMLPHVKQKPGNLSVHVAPSDIVKLLSACCA